MFCLKIEKDNRLEVCNPLQVTSESNAREVENYLKYTMTLLQTLCSLLD